MKLNEVVRSDRIFLDLDVRGSHEALEVMADHVSGLLGHGARRIQAALEERERLGSTALGDGFAIPHCKLEGANSVTVALFRFAQGVKIPGQQEALRFAIVVVSPPDRPALHLQALALLARVLKHDHVRHALLTAANAEAIVEILTAASAQADS